MRYATILAIVLLLGSSPHAQQGNYVLGDSYLTLNHPDYPGRVQFTELNASGTIGGQYPIETYWFVKPDASHVVVHVSTGSNVLFIELSGLNTLYTFPADESNRSSDADDVDVYIADHTGKIHEAYPSRTAKLTVKVERRDPLHLDLALDGSLMPQEKGAAPIAVTGRISLTKRSADLERLPGAYDSCDSTIYNRWSPTSDLGQWRSTTECEKRLFDKSFSAIQAAIEPVLAFSRAGGAVCNDVTHAFSDRLYRGHEAQPFGLGPFGHQRWTGSCQPNPSQAMKTIPLARITELAKRLAELPIDPPPEDRDRVNKERDQIQKEMEGIGQGLSNQEFVVEVKLNEGTSPDEILDISNGSIQRVGDDEYIVADTKSRNGNYTTAGGTYVLVGRWKAPEKSGTTVTFEPNPSASAQPLAVQAISIRFGCGSELAKTLVAHFDARALAARMPLTP